MTSEQQYTIGIIGFGFVGKAIYHGFAQTTNFRIYDINPFESVDTFEEVLAESDFIFVCLPTPTDFVTGGQDRSIIDGVVQQCALLLEDTKRILIIKSTVVPGTTQSYIDKYPNVNIVFNPEFLTERTSRLDFINQSRIILGGKQENTQKVEKLYRLRFPSVPICHVTATVAEAVKYFTNCFFAAKVSICNEFYEICQSLGIDYDKTMAITMLDGRIGNSHWQVPGPSGGFGFSGSCFPKDLNAFMFKAKELGIDPVMLKAAWEKNLQVRKDQDWLEIRQSASRRGRAQEKRI
jgi:UDPglucose 6-dehydrogenase